jgi:hypothetical protein
VETDEGQLSLESEESISRISRMLRAISHKIQVLNGCSHSLTDYSVVKGDTVEIHKEIINLWLNIIMIFRNQSLGTKPIALALHYSHPNT